MPPGGGREDPFVLKYLLTITAAAVAETGEGSRGVRCGTGRASLRVGSAQLRLFPFSFVHLHFFTPPLLLQ